MDLRDSTREPRSLSGHHLRTSANDTDLKIPLLSFVTTAPRRRADPIALVRSWMKALQGIVYKSSRWELRFMIFKFGIILIVSVSFNSLIMGGSMLLSWLAAIVLQPVTFILRIVMPNASVPTHPAAVSEAKCASIPRACTPYATGESIDEIYHRSLTGNISSHEHRPHDAPEKHCQDFLDLGRCYLINQPSNA